MPETYTVTDNTAVWTLPAPCRLPAGAIGASQPFPAPPPEPWSVPTCSPQPPFTSADFSSVGGRSSTGGSVFGRLSS